MLQGTKISFNTETNCFAKSSNNGFELRIENSVLNLDLYYDFSKTPLTLSSYVSNGNLVEIILLPYRIELHVNGKLVDEEWPFGSCLYKIGDEIVGDIEIITEEISYKEKTEPIIRGSFTNADGWHPEENVFVGDCMPYSDTGTYHVIYLKDRRHHMSKWCLGAHQWSHISTKDFKLWKIHPDVVKITESYEGSVCTGSWIKNKDKHYMFYTIRMSDGSPAPIRRSVSSDGYYYEKDTNFSFVLSDKYDTKNARDPKVIYGADGHYHMFITSSLCEIGKGCLAHFVSNDLNLWNEAEPIYISPDEDQPECPDYIEYNGFYYLIFSHKGKAQYLYSDKPFTDWKAPTNPTIPCESVPKGAIYDNKIVFSGFKRINGYAGTLCFKYAKPTQSGELEFYE